MLDTTFMASCGEICCDPDLLEDSYLIRNLVWSYNNETGEPQYQDVTVVRDLACLWTGKFASGELPECGVSLFKDRGENRCNTWYVVWYVLINTSTTSYPVWECSPTESKVTKAITNPVDMSTPVGPYGPDNGDGHRIVVE